MCRIAARTFAGTPRTNALFPSGRAGRIVQAMESRPIPDPHAPDPIAAGNPADDHPALYRALLDRVATLERIGDRAAAARIRMAATEIYSRAWDAAGRGRLLALMARADRTIEGSARPRAWSLRRRSVPVR